MITSSARRTVPCERCRNLHLRCKWPDDERSSGPCTRCGEDGEECSGMKYKTKPRACASCIRNRVRCHWDKDEDMCRRCVEKGGPTCPLPSRAFKDPSRRQPHPYPQNTQAPVAITSNTSVAIKTTTTTPPLPSPTVRSPVLELALSKEAMRILAKQGQLRLDSVECRWYPRTVNDDEPVGGMDELAWFINVMCGLRFCNFMPIPTVTGPVSMDRVTASQWLLYKGTKRSCQERGLQVLSSQSWDIVRAIPSITHQDTNSILVMVSSLRMICKMRLLNGLTEERQTLRYLTGYIVYLGAQKLQELHSDSDERKLLADSALHLALHEARLSVELSVPSSIPDAVFSVVCPRTQTGSTVYDTEKMAPLLGVSDAGSNINLYNYLWDHVLAQTVNDVRWLFREIQVDFNGDAPPEEQVRARWQRLDAVYADFDFVGRSIIIAAKPSKEGRCETAVRLLRSIFRSEMLVVELEFLSAMTNRRIPSSKAVNESNHHERWRVEEQSRLLAAVRRMARGIKRMTGPAYRLSEIFHGLDIVADLSSLGGYLMEEQLKLLTADEREILVESLHLASFWDTNISSLIKSWEDLGISAATH